MGRAHMQSSYTRGYKKLLNERQELGKRMVTQSVTKYIKKKGKQLS